MKENLFQMYELEALLGDYKNRDNARAKAYEYVTMA